MATTWTFTLTPSPMGSTLTPAEFATKWSGSTTTERAASQEHFIDLCRMIGVPTPHDGDPAVHHVREIQLHCPECPGKRVLSYEAGTFPLRCRPEVAPHSAVEAALPLVHPLDLVADSHRGRGPEDRGHLSFPDRLIYRPGNCTHLADRPTHHPPLWHPPIT